ncbi:hypothetical protein [Cysteiniphilum marinum]|uniref:hypothetical protein n=1 Tax=Cysteiniphilum marinum TaxID=2774191 RepID=UPI00193BDF6C|nr:hypothetical protein [Cysteiniphilum marinum]
MSLFSFKAKDVDAIKKIKPIKEGIVTFTVTEAAQEMMKSGESALELALELKDAIGTTKEIKRMFSLEDTYLLGLFCKAAGIYSQYQSESLSESDLVGATGQVKIERKKIKGKDGKNYNVIQTVEYLEKK